MLRKRISFFRSQSLPLSSLHLSIARYSNSTKTRRNLGFSNSQITKNGRNGDPRGAQFVFDGMPVRDVVSWTALLTAYGDNGEVSSARKVFDQMPTRNTVSWNAMMSAYVRASKVWDAFELFSKIPEKNEVSYGAMIAGFAKSGMIKDAEMVYEEMPRMWRDPVASNALICGYLRKGQLDEAVRIFNAMEVKDVISWSSMVDAFCKFGSIFDAREIFDSMPERNVISWTSMIRGYFKVGFLDDGFNLFLEMRRKGVEINPTTLSVLLDACAEFCRIEEGVQIHGLINAMGFESDGFLGNSIIIMYSRTGWMVAARRKFDCMNMKDVVSWNSLITGYIQHGAIEEAHVLFESMPEKDVVSWTSMVVGFSNRGWMRESLLLFEQMPHKDEVAWTAVISGYVGNGEHESALQWFSIMVREGYMPNSVTLSCILSALASLVSLEQGMQVHACAVKMALGFDITVQSSLVSMYAKCGSLGDAYLIFSQINEPSLVTINSMITSFAQHGLAEEALKLFAKMQRDGYKPNEATFLGILSACAHAGLVEEGYKYFESMGSIYGIKPTPEHYTCMVDLLGRAGLLVEALEFINSMPYETNSDSWGALLNACKIHSNLNVAKIAAQKLFELEPNNATVYTVLSSMLSLAGLKEDEQRLRMVQLSSNIRKKPGYSWTDTSRVKDGHFRAT
ncbi:pentatricopeptide repeat-containing protein At1g53600, mitochondrial [Typha latifolia]|uniref:pentatricopeptide repeat-containing protein At1g53600, mitochondrial n=1 Tax=Typha latifolia TaxID=4733 RepID=UPI003C2AB254